MASFSTPAEMRAYIVERLVGETGEPDEVLAAAQALCNRVEPAFAASLADLLATPLKIELQRVEVGRVADARSCLDAGHVLGRGSGPGAPDGTLLLLDPQALALLVSAMFGGDPSLPVGPIARDPSPIELDVAAAVLSGLAEALNSGGARGLGLVLPLPPVLGGPEAKRVGLRDGPAVRIVFRLSAAAASGDINLFIVQRVLLSRQADLSGGAEDAAWGARFGEEVMRSTAELQAVMPMARLTLGAIAALAPGDVVPLDPGATESARILVRGKTLYICDFGRLGANYTVRVREPFDAEKDLMDGLLPG